ncbi:MAG: ATP-NAD kinase [Thermoproteota archaeon]
MLAPLKSDRSLAREVSRIAERIGLELTHPRNLEELKELDEGILLIIGEDRDVLKILHYVKSRKMITLGVSKTENNSFLMETTLDKLEESLKALSRGEHGIEYSYRLKTIVDGVETPYALNELAIFPKRSATVLEYSLYVDREFIWRDIGDGLIVSTPIGSTAYSLSTGGPIIHPNARVVSIVPVNSLNLARRPLVAPLESIIEIREISSSSTCEVILDGRYRMTVVNQVLVEKGEEVGFVRFKSETLLSRRLEKKVRMSIDISSLPPSAKLILKVLEYEGPLTQKDIVKKTMLPARTVRHALAILMGKSFITKRPLIRDPRQDLYFAEAR